MCTQYILFIITLKPIFYSKTGLRWVPNTNEIDTNNMKCTCPRQGPNAKGPNTTYIPPACVGLPGFTLGLSGFALGLQGLLDTNMLVFTQYILSIITLTVYLTYDYIKYFTPRKGSFIHIVICTYKSLTAK